MGNSFRVMYLDGNTPYEVPPINAQPTFDPQYGFKGPRKPRECSMSEQEMKALQIKPELRDFCAPFLKEYSVCRKKYEPFYIFCANEQHAYKHCKIEDYIIRMKEYERERRLRVRELRKKGKSNS